MQANNTRKYIKLNNSLAVSFIRLIIITANDKVKVRFACTGIIVNDVLQLLQCYRLKDASSSFRIFHTSRLGAFLKKINLFNNIHYNLPASTNLLFSFGEIIR